MEKKDTFSQVNNFPYCFLKMLLGAHEGGYNIGTCISNGTTEMSREFICKIWKEETTLETQAVYDTTIIKWILKD